MSFMTEKKAKEVLGQYMKAEVSSNDTLAIQLERDLNNAGWYIVSGQDGLTVQRKENDSLLPNVDDFYIPKESTVAPSPNGDNPNRSFWITFGITTAIIALIIVVFLIIKYRKNATQYQ
jgi:hypothetical protein